MRPIKIIATKNIYQPDVTMLWTDIPSNIEDCNGYLEPANMCVLREIREHGRTYLDYYELDNAGNVESIIEISEDNLNFLIEFGIILIIE